MTTDPKDADIARLTAEVETLTTSGIIEVAARNPNVMSYIQHWETRTEKAEAERDAALAREAALLASNQTNRDLLYQLSGAQSEVTHMRNRFDTAVATARAEGRKEGLREAADVCVCIRQAPETAEDEAIGAMMCASAILAAAEKEAPDV